MKKSGIFLIVLVIAIAVSGIYGNSVIQANAFYDEAKTVHLTNAEIGNSTLVIGTHLIYLGAMDEQVYEIAQQSANESGQKKVYYKSELSDGAWYDITDSSSLADISTAGTPVAASVVEALKFNYYTREDGLTYDLNSNEGICIFDINSPYQLETMTALESLKDQYLILKKKSSRSDSDQYILSLLDQFFEQNLQTAETKAVDEQLEGLQIYFNFLVSGGTSMEKRSAVHTVMARVDAKRRALVYKRLYEVTLQTLIKQLQGISADGVPDNFQTNSEINSGATSALGGIQESYMTNTNKMLSEGTTVLGRLEYSYTQRIIEAATQGNQDLCDTYVEKLCHLFNIQDGIIVSEAQELQLIEDELLDEVGSAYVNKLGTGGGAEYKAGVTNGFSQSVLTQLLKMQQNNTNAARSELQFIIKAKVNRLSNDRAQEFVKKRIEEAGVFKNSIQEDAFAPYARESFEQYMNWLTTLLKNLVEKSPEGSEMGKLVKVKENLLKKKQDALDQNDLAAAKRLDAEIDGAVGEIEKLEQQLSVVLSSKDSSESEKAAARANMGKGSAAADIAAVTENALEQIQEGNMSGVADALAGVTTLMAGNKGAAIDALGEISDALAVASVTASANADVKQVLNQTKELIASNADLLLGTLSEDSVDEMLEEIYGSAFSKLSADKQASILIAMNRYVDATGDETVANLLVTRAQALYSQGNQYIYPKLQSEASEYASIVAISRCSGYRYIYSDAQLKSILQRRGSYYLFSAFSTTVKRSAVADIMATQDLAEITKATSSNAENISPSSTDDTLNNPAGFQGCIYIPADYVKRQFGFTAEYLLRSDYGVLATDIILKEAEDVLEKLYSLGS